ncbi:MAG: type II toxin-antitoxin system RelE/ParE family toxin [Desulfomonile tiedjei]|nr:type II toxin-antitoxin system RelE/ParE family toxin [Desulfomonile tiedjei]
MKPVIIHSQAKVELDKAIAFYEKQRAGLGLDLQTAVEGAIGRIQQHPQLGAPYKSIDVRQYVIRRFPYMIFYAELEEAIWIVAVAHGKRKPEYWSRRRMG